MKVDGKARKQKKTAGLVTGGFARSGVYSGYALTSRPPGTENQK
jgi:hypothetical protein